MFFGISDDELLDKNKVKIIDGIAGAGKSTQVVDNLTRLGEKFCLASFSNALKFAAADKFGCPVDTICGLAFVNTPYPRSAEKEVTEYDTVVLDEILLDGVSCLKWIIHNVGKVNIIALTDSHQMLSADNSKNVISTFNQLSKYSYVRYINIDKTKRARNEFTREIYNTLYELPSEQLYNLDGIKQIFMCNSVNFEKIDFDETATYICHSNAIEHEIYNRYKISSNRNIELIPKNHISRLKDVNFDKYPICDQITATEKHIDAYLQAANIATPTRYQGKEVDVGRKCYFVVEEDSLFTGREIYTVGTRCQDINSLVIAVIKVTDYKDPEKINNVNVVNAIHLNIPEHDKTFKHVSGSDMAKIIKEYGDPATYYKTDYILSDENVIYSTMPASALNNFCDINEDPDNYTVTIRKKKGGAKRSIKSITKKDTTMHFDFMARVYDILKYDVTPPRITNTKGAHKDDFDRAADIFSAFPTVLYYADMPAAGTLYEEYDKDLLNFYMYKGDKVTKGSLITEELADKLGDSEYVFSTSKQQGCELGNYTYEQCLTSEKHKAKIRENFLWGILEKGYYKKETVAIDGDMSLAYVKYARNNLELVACALWSKLCCIMLDAIDSVGAKKFFVATDCLYYNGDKMPVFPEWCDYRIEDKLMERMCGKDTNKKYDNIIFKTY